MNNELIERYVYVIIIENKSNKYSPHKDEFIVLETMGLHDKTNTKPVSNTK